MSELLEVCERAARAGGEVLLQWQDRIRAKEKGPADLVTEADLASQRVIRDIVLAAFPDHGFVGEEDARRSPWLSGQLDDDAPEYWWIVDPLDGTTNYVHRLQTFSVSVAVARRSEVLAGVVFDPVTGECFRAEAGRGADLGGQPLAVSRCGDLGAALVATSFSTRVAKDSPEIKRFVEVLHRCRSLRRLGSAALNLCYLASGRLDAYFTSSVKPWDVAAGVLIVCEAGGVVTDLKGEPFQVQRPQLAASATLELHAQLLRCLAAADEPDGS